MKRVFAISLLVGLVTGCSDPVEKKLAKEFGATTAQQLNDEKIHLLLVARRDVPQGARLALDDLGMKNFRQSDIRDMKAVIALASSEDGVRYTGKVTSRDLKKGEPILISDISNDAAKNEPAAVPESPARPERSGGPLDAARGGEDGK